MQEYAAVASILSYVIIEFVTRGALALLRLAANEAWSALARTTRDVIVLPELGFEIPVIALYEGVDLTDP